MMEWPPALPPFVPMGCPAIGAVLVSLNLRERFSRVAAAAMWCPSGNKAIPAGLEKIVLASSAVAAPPAKAFPLPEPFWLLRAKPEANAAGDKAAAIVSAMILRV